MKVIVALLLGMIAAPAVAQDMCRDENTLAECWTSHAGSASGLTQKLKEEAIAKDQPGANAAGPQVRSTVTDLLPLLNVLGVISDSDTSDGTVVADLNFLIPGAAAENHNAQLKWALNVNPAPFEPLIAAFAEPVREDRKKALAGRLNDTADSELQFSWSLVNRHLGRDFRPHRESMNAIMGPVITKVRTPALVAKSNLEFMAVIQPYLKLLPDDFMTAKFNALGGDKDAVRAVVIRGATSSGVAQKEVVEGLRPLLAASGVDRLAELVLLQPQLLFGATRRFRDELAGPDAWGAKVTFEGSFASFSDFLDSAGNRCDTKTLPSARLEDATTASCYAALNEYLADHDDDLKSASRWKAALEYRQVADIRYSFIDDGVELDLPKTDRLIASLGYGRTVQRTAASDRVDFEASYDSNLDADASNKSRFVVSLTYTRRIGDLDIPFGVVYANKSEYLEGVDKQISLHVGVKFKVPE